ncbi:MAG: hypothetical protein MPK06_04310 [Alphaproteobacteria bacterium]|nr:hypothetical protein [Alphaproteobacteria bacterium]MDA8003688.1 hypothetical protein [Alphaproteobacteria bacterium]MDA8005744.1 hypothetical protein [Alphaproteobacteria bacterium]MDA8013107.1 hypothetical protein [Alphaproteobacteria bacterium]
MQTLLNSLDPLAVETKSINQSIVAPQTEKPITVIALVSFKSNRTNLNGAEAKAEKPAGCASIFIVSGGETDRIRKRNTRKFD